MLLLANNTAMIGKETVGVWGKRSRMMVLLLVVEEVLAACQSSAGIVDILLLLHELLLHGQHMYCRLAVLVGVVGAMSLLRASLVGCGCNRE